MVIDDKKQAENFGTVSHATMRPQDLIPAFLDELDQLWHAKSCELVKQYDYIYPIPDSWYHSDDCHWLLDDLFDALNECAPDNGYFGAHIGDGSDYGFWPVENEE